MPPRRGKKRNTPDPGLGSGPKTPRIATSSADTGASGTAAAAHREQLEAGYGMPFPEEFFEILGLCERLGVGSQGKSGGDPCLALQDLGIQLVGPFDFALNGALPPGCSPHLHHRYASERYRYPFDPPEVLTCAAAIGSPGHHIGYFRDDPSALPTGAVCDPIGGGCFRTMGPSLAAALVEYGATHAAGSPLLDELGRIAARSAPPKRGATVDKTLSGLGIVVPYDRKTDVGWRPLSVSNAQLKKYLQSLLDAKARGAPPDFTELDRLITYANIANDEMDPGQPLKLGLDLFQFGVEFSGDALALLQPTYGLLGRGLFAEIIGLHCGPGDERRRAAIPSDLSKR